jgi:hypothetical protein
MPTPVFLLPKYACFGYRVEEGLILNRNIFKIIIEWCEGRKRK